MSKNNVHNNAGGRSYHSPIRPWLRGPAIVAGALLLSGGLFLGLANGDWRWHPIVMGVVFISVGLTPAEMRHDGLRSSSVLIIAATFLAVVFIAVSWVFIR